MTRSGGATRRAAAVVVAFVMVAAWVVAGAPAASASTGGSAEALAADVTVGPVEVLGIELVPAVSTTIASVGTPAPDSNGFGTNSASVANLSLAGVTTGLLDSYSFRSPAGLATESGVLDLEIDLLVDDLITASAVSSLTSCPIPGVGTPVAQAQVVGLQVAGLPATVGTVDIPVDVDLGIVGVTSAVITVDVTEIETTTATSADATGLVVTADLLVLGPGDVVLLDATILDLALAAGSCTQPTGVAPTLTSIDPTEGPEGTTVTLTGTHFIPDFTTVDFGALDVTPTNVFEDGTQLTFVVPDGAPLGPTTVTVTTPAGTSNSLEFTVTDPPTVLTIDPEAGPRGTTVTITGAEFVPGDTQVRFGGIVIPAGDVAVSVDGTTLEFDVPDAAPFGPTDVSVITPGGESGPLGFTVLDVPTISELDPELGPELTLVTVTGTQFHPGLTEVLFGDVVIPASAVDVTSPTTLTFVVPDDSPLGLTDVAVRTPAGVSDDLAFAVTPAMPVADALVPDAGPEGTVVTVTGDNFIPGGTNVMFGDVVINPADVAVAPDGDSLTFVVPDDSPLGATDVYVITAGGVTDPLTFVVTMPAPTIDDIDPDEGPVGTVVTIIGDDFVPGDTTVIIGDIVIPPGNVTVSPDGDSLTFVVPPGTPLGQHPVVVVTDGGVSGALPFTVTDGSGGGGGGGGGGDGAGGGSGGGRATGVTPRGSLPYTGDSASTFLAAGLVLVLAGLTVAVGAHLARRRPALPAPRPVPWWRP